MTVSIRPQTATALAAALCVTLASTGCSSVGDALSGDKVDYRNTGTQTVRLDVPPDLSQLPGQSRFGQVTSSTVTASSLGGSAGAPATLPVSVAINQVGAYKLERRGQTRWLTVALPPEQLWPALRSFWLDQGFDLPVDQAETGTLETSYQENRAKVPQDGALRKTLGRVFDMLYDTGERDSYRMRLERTATGSEIYIAHRGLSEQYETAQKDRTVWRGRPSDPQLEAEMLSRLLVKLGVPKASADATVAAAAQAPEAQATAVSTYARLNDDKASLTLDTDLDTAWRRVGLALDRSGFTVESRDRKQGSYDIRLSDSDVEANRPGFFARMFGAKAVGDGLSRFRVTVQAQGKQAQVQVLSDTGKTVADNPMAQRVAKQLLDELI
jgi:outer membrane protein assembly factor BamC